MDRLLENFLNLQVMADALPMVLFLISAQGNVFLESMDFLGRKWPDRSRGQIS